MAKLLQLLEVVFALLAVTSTASGQLSPLTEGLSVLTTPLQREIERHIDTLKPTIGRLLNVSPDTQFSQIFPTISNFNQSQIIECYNSTIGETQFDIFKNTIFDAIKAYYVWLCSLAVMTINWFNLLFVEKFSGKLWSSCIPKQSQELFSVA